LSKIKTITRFNIGTVLKNRNIPVTHISTGIAISDIGPTLQNPIHLLMYYTTMEVR